MADAIEVVGLLEETETTTALSKATISSQAFVKFTPLAGIRLDDGPVCYLLEVDNTKILIDCGIDPLSMSMDHLQPLLDSPAMIKSIDAVLITHSSLTHCGALAALWQQGLRCPVYATTPVHHLALLNGFEAAQGFRSGSSLPDWISPRLFEQVLQDDTFLHQVRYSQPIALPGGLVAIALPAGHSPGATMWRLRKHGEDIVVAMRFNHRRELTLDGATTEVFSRPSLMVLDATSALMVGKPRVQRDMALLDVVKACQGHVLCVVSYERCLEVLSLLMDQLDQIKRPVYLVGHQAHAFLEVSKGMLEYMSAQMMRKFESTKENPFDYSTDIQCVSHLNELDRILHRQVIYVTATIERGLGLELLLRLHNDKQNAICVLDGAISEENLAYKLLNAAHVNLPIWEQEFLEGEDLRRWKQKEQMVQREAQADEIFAAMQQRKARISDDLADFLDERDLEEDDDVVEPENVVEETKENDQELNIESAKMMKEVFWSDYRPDWTLELDRSLAMRLWIQDPEMASISMLGGLTAQCRFQAFPLHSSIALTKKNASRSLLPARFNSTAYGIALDTSFYKIEDIETPSLKSSQPPKKSYISRAPVIIRDLRPHRWICKQTTLTLKCQRKLIDFRGIIDGKSLKTIVAQIGPRRVIVVGAGDIPTDFLANHLSLSGSCQVIAPQNRLECINVSQSQHLVSAVITDELAANTLVVNFNGYELGLVHYAARADNDKLFLEENRQPRNALFMIGDLRLAQIRKQLTARLPSLQSEFVQGDLVISLAGSPIIMIRKTDDDELTLETLSNKAAATYYPQVRSLLYSQLAIIK